MNRKLMRGNEAFAEAVVRAGCGFFAGYPITPQSEILEYLSWRLPQVGKTFIQCESELAAISMVYGAAATGERVMTSTSGPGFSLMQEGISYIASAELPCLLLDVQRYGSGLGDIYTGQSDYWQATKNGGHSDYRMMVLAPNSVQESIDLVSLGFEKAEEHRMPVLILSDASIAEMIEPASFEEIKNHDQNQFEWALKGKGDGQSKRHTSVMYYMSPETYNQHLRDKYAKVEEDEQLYETFLVEDATHVMVAYGISSRICREAVEVLRAKGLKVGLLRPISLYPFPKKAFAELPTSVKALVSVEMSALGQMIEDIALHSQDLPIYAIRGGAKLYSTEFIIDEMMAIMNDERKVVY